MPGLGHCLLAFRQNSRLTPNVAELTDDSLVPLHEAKQSVRDTNVPAEVLHKLLCLAQIVSRYPGIQMVDGLELESAVEEVKPLRAVNVHCGAEHPLRETLVDTQVGGRHGEVAECDLHVQGHGDDMRDHDEGKSVPAGLESLIDDEIPEPIGEEDLTGKLKPARPPRWASLGCLATKKIDPRLDIQVEPAKAEDRIIHPLLMLNKPLREFIVKAHNVIVICAVKTVEELVRYGKEG